jgi:uroporphyrinogen-III synthase
MIVPYGFPTGQVREARAPENGTIVNTSSPREGRPLVVVTRDGARAAALATRLADQDADVVTLPVTRTVAATPAEWAALLRFVEEGGHDAIIVASVNAAESLIRALAEASPSGVGAMPVFAVGTATAETLAAAGILSELAPRADAIGVAEHAIARGARRVLWPRAEGGREEGIERLRAAGVEVDAPVAYRTNRTSPDEPDVVRGLDALLGKAAPDGGVRDGRRADALCVYAPSQVAALEALLGDRGWGSLSGVGIVAIGETTAAALRARGVEVAEVADAPDPESMARAVARVLHRSP